VAHRDVKLSNALLFEGGKLLKLADLGLAVHSSQCQCMEDGAVLTRESVGTASTAAPEVIEAYHAVVWHCPFTADAWSLGVCTLTLLAPREFDEAENRPAFYPFTVADVNMDEDFAAFVAPPPPLPPPGLIQSTASALTLAHDRRSATARLLRRRVGPAAALPLNTAALPLLDSLMDRNTEARLPVATAARYLAESCV